MINVMTKKRLIFIGAPGTGKGTISQMLKSQWNYVHLSTGNLFRNISKQDHALGQTIATCLQAGKYVSDEITNAVIEQTFASDANQLRTQGFILDGYPRTLGQAKFLATLTPIDCVILLAVNDFTPIIKRLSNRLVCLQCQTVYNTSVVQTTPKVSNQCDFDHSTLTKRKDDEPQIIQDRIEHYLQSIQPVIDFYDDCNQLVKIDASLELSKLYDAVVAVLK